MGMGSIVGTGVFVSIALAAEIAGPAVLLAIVLAACVATCNALNSAQLAASHPVSGGTYEYGYKYLRPWLGFTAGWMFLCAKTASAATAALGFTGYLLAATGVEPRWLVPVALGTVAVVTGLVLAGIRQSYRANTVIVSISLFSLLFFCGAGTLALLSAETGNLPQFFRRPDAPGSDVWTGGTVSALLHATALMFVAFTGYGRIATLSEEVHDPARTIPRAILWTLCLTALLYVAVGAVLVGTASLSTGPGGTPPWSGTRGEAAPLEAVAARLGGPGAEQIVTLGALTAMLGVSLNLVLGLSRVLLAMGRRGDMPPAVARINRAETTPYVAVALVGAAVAGFVLIGSVKVTWSFSAFTVLIYYAITNLAALQLARDQRLYPRGFAWAGLAACLLLAFWVEWQIWLFGLGLILVGILWHAAATALNRRGLGDGSAP